MTEKEEIKLHRFMKQMSIEQDNNSHKGSLLEWEGLKEKITDFEYHKAKLMLAIKEENEDAIKEFIADCGNILLAIGDEFSLYENPSTNTGRTQITKESVFRDASLKEAEEQRKRKHKKVKNIEYSS